VKQEDLNRLYQEGILSALDIHFAGFMERLAGTRDPELWLAAAMVSSYTNQGHICLDLLSVDGSRLLTAEDGKGPVVFPRLPHWCKKLSKTSVVGKPGEYAPLILDDRSRLYLHRYWDYQEKLADLIRIRVHDDEEDMDMSRIKEGLERVFGSSVMTQDPSQGEDVDWQQVAAFTSLIKRFCVVSGGPGTGKTTTIVRMLALILEQTKARELRIALAAPTGKAAAKLQEAIKRGKEELNCSDKIKEAIPEEATTLHRLLGSIPDSPYFRHHAKNLLPVDVAVVDEASMVDLALMSKLTQALSPQARLILLGDKDQLASVEAGAVLGDICDTGHAHSFSRPFRSHLKKATGFELPSRPHGEEGSRIQDCIVQLQKSFRFGSQSGIRAVSQAVNAGEPDRAIKLLMDGSYTDMTWKDLPRPHGLPHMLKDMIIQSFRNYSGGGDILEVFQRFDGFRILCAIREGPYGVMALNALVEQILKKERLIEKNTRWYPGRPVLITSNDYHLGLFNGDVGIVLPDSQANDELRVFFLAADGAVRKFHPLRLPEHETVHAMTVHKSQGSEFARVLLLLPDRDVPILTRELIYTGITRAKRRVAIWGTEAVFRAAISRRIERSSGLRDALWGS
jgi:exodeoxyribonuclease V alpha subunit